MTQRERKAKLYCRLLNAVTPILDFCLLLCLKARKITHPHEKQNRYFEMEYKEGMRVWPGFLAGSNQEEEDGGVCIEERRSSCVA